MLPALRAFSGRLNLTLFGIAVLCATFWFTDHTTNRHPPAPQIDRAALVAAHASRPPGPKLYVLILDSLRYGTAMDEKVMPNLAALRTEGVYAKVKPGFNSSSAAAIRDCFTGRENAAVLALVATFLKTDAGVESIFHQMAQAGLTSTAHSMGFFTQFGSGVTHEFELPYRCPPEQEEESMLAAARELTSGEYDVAVGHLSYTDYAAHDFGPFRAEYREMFHRADALIPRIRALLPPDVTFAVMGDHGHDQTGKHGFGMDVPTFTTYVGPPFKRGYDLGVINLTSHRYLMSHAEGLSVTTDSYSGEYLPQALSISHGGVEWLKARVQAARIRSDRWASWFIWIYISLLATLWFNLLCRGRSPLVFTKWRLAGVWLTLLPLLLAGRVQMVVGAALMTVVLVALSRTVPPKSWLGWVGLPVLAGLGFQGWGRVLVALHPTFQQISYGAMGLIWLAIATAAALGATRSRRATVMWVVAAPVLLLLQGTNERYGFQGAIAPLLGGWFLLFTISHLRGGGAIDTTMARRLIFVGAGLFLLLQPFAATGVNSGTVGRWHSLVPGLDSDNLLYLVLLALFAKIVIFFPTWPGIGRVLLGSVLICGLVAQEARIWGPDAYTTIALLVTCLTGWLVLGKWMRRSEGRLFRLTFWFLLYYYWTALTPRNFLDISCLIGALVLAARTVKWFPQRENLRADYLVFAALGLVVTGWACMRWSTSDLEWHAAYEFFSAPTVEHGLGALIPWIVFKCLLVWIILVRCLDDELGALLPLPANTLLVLFGVKLASMLLLNLGLGGVDTLNRSYLESACVSGVLAILFVGLVLLPRAWPWKGALTAEKTPADPAAS